MIVRYGKENEGVIGLGRRFWDPVGQDLDQQDNAAIYEIYRAQPPRQNCKNCGFQLRDPAFHKQGINYIICSNCSHLNGEFEDTEAFYAAQFTDNGGDHVAQHYAASDRVEYEQRVEVIYAPKVEFLMDVIRAEQHNPLALSYLDIGAGTGHFVSALKRAGAKARGLEASSLQVEMGRKILGNDCLDVLDPSAIEKVAAETSAQVVTMVFVLEHVLRPTELIQAFADNPNIQYLLVAVPIHSPAAYIEMMFPTVYERHLAGHTHLYTDQSLDWLCHHTGFRRVGEWWFGSDMMDLLRSFSVRMHQLGQPASGVEDWKQMITPLLDDMQLAIDKRKLSSEVHLILRRED